jgi:hypothetical protein
MFLKHGGVFFKRDRVSGKTRSRLKKRRWSLEKSSFLKKGDKGLAWLQCMPMKHFFNLAFVKSIELTFMNDDSF